MHPERFATQSVYKFVWYFLRPYKWYVAAYIFWGFVAGFCSSFSSNMAKIIIDRLTDLPDGVISPVLVPACGYIFILLLNELAWRVSDYIYVKTGPVIRNDIIHRAFAYVHMQAHQYFQDNLSGTIASNIIMMADHFEIALRYPVMSIVRGSVSLVVALVCVYFVHPVFSLLMLIWTIGYIFMNVRLSSRIEALAGVQAESLNLMSGKAVDSIANVYSARVFAQRPYESEYLNTYLEESRRTYQAKDMFMVKVYSLQGGTYIILMAVIMASLLYLRTQHLITVGDFALILGLCWTVTSNIWWMAEQMSVQYSSFGKCAEAIRAIYTPLKIVDAENAGALEVQQGKIVFESVKFVYKNAAPIFENKNVTILPGQKVGLVGYSGAGKSTFINLILRIFDLSSGRILIDEQDICHVTLASLYESIGVIPQEPVLFDRTVAENIAYGRTGATEEEIIEAAKKARAHEFILRMPEGYQSSVGERGMKLSGGQRQRIAIARAILKNAPILVVDEATSQLDSVTEREIQASLWELMQGKTALVVAHRLSTLLHMDRILVFERGRIIEDGTHQQLLAKEGLYAALWQTQSGGFLQDEKKPL